MGLAFGALAAPQPKKPDLEAVERAVLAGTNELRHENGLPPLRRNAQLARAAHDLADFMAKRDEYGHDADGRTPTQRARAAGYRDCMVAENIAYQMRSRGFDTPELAERLVKGWAASPGHRRNMLDEEAVEIGIAVAHSEETSRYYGVQLFGRPESMRVTFEMRNESRDTVAYKVGNEAYSLAGRSTRRHHICGDLPLVITKTNSERRFKPGPGDRFTITPAGNVTAASP